MCICLKILNSSKEENMFDKWNSQKYKNILSIIIPMYIIVYKYLT